MPTLPWRVPIITTILLALIGLAVLPRPGPTAVFAPAAPLEQPGLARPAPLPTRSTLTVCQAGPPDCMYQTVQDAVDAASDGDLIKVAAGVYTDVHSYGGHWQVVYLSRTLTIRGGYTSTNGFADPPDPAVNPTILDPRRLGRTIYVSGAVSATVEGLQLTGGQADFGGGVALYTATATLRNNAFWSNQAHYGGGIYAYTSRVTLVANTFLSNTASYIGGGGLTGSGHTTLTANLVTSNTAGTGGGFYLGSEVVTLTENTFTSNVAQYECAGLTVEVYGGRAALIGNTIAGNVAGWNGGGLCFGEAVARAHPRHERRTPAGRAGLSQAFLLLQGNRILSNSASMNGGGAFLSGDGGIPAFSGNDVQHNSAGQDGGGLYLDWSSEHTLIEGNTFARNEAGRRGGGLYLGISFGTVRGNLIRANQAGGDGGGIYGRALLDGNTLQANTAAGAGGGLWGGGRLESNWVLSNTASTGGGLYLQQSRVTNTVVAANVAISQGSGLYLEGEDNHLWHTTVAGNGQGDGSGVHVQGTAALTNTILISHSVGITVAHSGEARLEATLWGNETDWAGEGRIVSGTINLWGDPRFAAPAGGDYHLSAGSVAIEAGTEAGVRHDIDGQARPAGPRPDLGADEFPAGLTLRKDATPHTPIPGGMLTYTLHLTNSGQLPLNTTIVDTLPSAVSPTGVLSWTVLGLPPQQAWSTTIVVIIPTAYRGTLTNTVTATSEEGALGSYIHSVWVGPYRYQVQLPLIVRRTQ